MNSWRSIQSTNIRCIKKLSEFLELSQQNSSALIKSPFPLNLPLRLAKKIQKGSLNDPILKQFVPLAEENSSSKLSSQDPLSEADFLKEPKLLHKYQGRLLLLPTSACAMHCRYCFRRHFPYENKEHSIDKEISYIEQNKSISEVILSGGDPLSLSNANLKKILSTLSSIKHIKRIRFHSRFIIGIPERIDEELISILENTGPQIIFVIHINHPIEIDKDICNAVSKLQKIGIPILNQGVLLAGVNDSFKVLNDLCLKLINNGIIPYYLHDLDYVQGSDHFRVSREKALSIIDQLKETLPGYALPKFVFEQPHKKSKTEIH